MAKEKCTFDPQNPDKKLVRMVLHQAFDGGAGGLKEIYAAAWCLGNMEVDDWRKLKKHMLDNELIEESGEDEYFRMTDKGQDVLSGEDY